jgi:hypothetical protein
MTSNYAGEPGWVECPILRNSLRWAREELTYDMMPDDMREVYDNLKERCRSAPATHAYICLRGFIIIEEMLTHLQTTYDEQYRLSHSPQISLRLVGRSWMHLTEAKKSLDSLDEELGMELSESKLGGAQYDEKNVVFVPNRVSFDPVFAVSTARKSSLAKQMIYLTKATRNSIDALRPYLRNEEAPVSRLGEYLVRFMRGVYEFGALSPIVNIMQKITDVRL